MGAHAGAPLDPQTYALLKRAVEMKVFQPEALDAASVERFQSSVALLRAAKQRGLIDAWLALPSRSPAHKGQVVFVVVNEITTAGKALMARYEARPLKTK